MGRPPRLVVLQVAALEDLVDQIILYLAAPSDQEEMRLKLPPDARPAD
jgi:hypothetical protein